MLQFCSSSWYVRNARSFQHWRWRRIRAIVEGKRKHTVNIKLFQLVTIISQNHIASYSDNTHKWQVFYRLKRTVLSALYALHHFHNMQVLWHSKTITPTTSNNNECLSFSLHICMCIWLSVCAVRVNKHTHTCTNSDTHNPVCGLLFYVINRWSVIFF